MLKRYYIDVSALSDNEIVILQNQLNKFAFEIFEKFSNDGLHIVGLDVLIMPEHNINKITVIPPQCTVTEM